MAYSRTTWANGDTITATKLNNLESGVANNDSNIGSLSNLHTTAKDNLVAAINEVAQSGGGGEGLTTAVKSALLQLASKVAYIDNGGQDYYDDLYDALYPDTPAPTLSSISAVYTQSGTVYTTTSLNSLKSDLVVTAHYSDTSTETVPSSSYTLSGTLTVGTSTVTVSYGGKTTTFTVTVTEAPTLSSISAVYTQSGTVYDTDSLDSLKTDLVVTATYSDSSTATVPSADYTLSGTLTVGTSTVTVSYGGKTTTFTVTVTHSIDTTAEIATADSMFIHKTAAPQYRTVEKTNCGVTIKYQMTTPTTVLYPAGIIPTDDISTLVYNDGGNNAACLFIYDSNDNALNYVNELTTSALNRWVQDIDGTMTEFKNTYTVTEYSSIAFTVDTRYLDDAYMYDYTTGQVWFAGINTPYYGMTNISQAGA